MCTNFVYKYNIKNIIIYFVKFYFKYIFNNILIQISNNNEDFIYLLLYLLQFIYIFIFITLNSYRRDIISDVS